MECELNEDDCQDISKLGNWSLNVQESRYSTKMPLCIIQSKARLHHKINWNPRLELAPPESLRKSVFPWLDKAIADLNNHESADDRFTATKFLELLDDLRTITIQDAAALAHLFPSRTNHTFFKLPIFCKPEFLTYKEAMGRHLQQSKPPWDSSLEQLLPGLNTRFAGLQSGLSAQTTLLEQMVHASVPAIQRDVTALAPFISNAIDLNIRTILSEMLIARASIARPAHAPSPLGQGNSSPMDYAASPTSPSTQAPVAPTAPAFPGYNYDMPNVKSATALWDAWFGTGQYKDVPVVGGILALEKQKKQNIELNWRKEYAPKDNKKVSRWRLSVKYMLEEKGLRTDHDDFITEMDVLYRQNKTRAVTPFSNLMTRRRNLRLSSLSEE